MLVSDRGIDLRVEAERKFVLMVITYMYTLIVLIHIYTRWIRLGEDLL